VILGIELDGEVRAPQHFVCKQTGTGTSEGVEQQADAENASDREPMYIEFRCRKDAGRG
jgi:hypothetical protein